MIHAVPNLAVAHDQFGIGFVEAIDRQKVTVVFVASGRRKIHQAWLRVPSKGLLPYRAPARTIEDQLAQFAGAGNVEFVVVSAGVDEFVGATVGEFVIDVDGDLFALQFLFEHPSLALRVKELDRFSNFSRALGVPAPDDTDDYIGRRACFRIAAPGDFPDFSRIAE